MDEARLFSVVCSNRRKSNGLKLAQRKLCTNKQKSFFTVRVTDHWERLPREVVESPPWRSSKAAWTWAWVPCSGCPCWSRGWA